MPVEEMIGSPRLPDAVLRILIVDDHQMVRDGLQALVEREPDMIAVGEACDGAGAIARFRALRPDVTLMDIQMPGMDGIEAIEKIRQMSQTAAILVLTTYPGDARATRAIRAGASGYLLKSCVRKELTEAIRSVSAGRRVLSAEIASELAAFALDDQLTEREIAILRLVADGHSNKLIGWHLGLSLDTIKGHLKSIYAKLTVDDRAHAVTVATRRGFIGS